MEIFFKYEVLHFILKDSLYFSFVFSHLALGKSLLFNMPIMV